MPRKTSSTPEPMNQPKSMYGVIKYDITNISQVVHLQM
jgi:hypothetical protein